MAKHEVKCAVCGKIFDLNLIQGVRYSSNRYAHAECFPNGEIVPLPEPKPIKAKKEDPDLTALKEYINFLFKEPNWALIMKQIKKYKEEFGYSYTGIFKSLKYFYEIKKNDISKANNSIAIVPFIYNDAKNYYYNLFLTQQANEAMNIRKEEKEIEIIIKPPKIKKRIRLFKFEEEEQ